MVNRNYRKHPVHCDFDMFEGYLSDLVPKGSEIEFDLSGVKVQAGDYNLKQLNESFLVDGLSMLTTGESAGIRIEVPEMNRFGEFAPQIDKARAGLLAASRLIELSHQIQL